MTTAIKLTPLPDLQWSFNAPGARAGVFTENHVYYTDTNTALVSVKLEEGILDKDGKVVRLGTVAQLDAQFTPDEIATTMVPMEDPRTGLPMAMPDQPLAFCLAFIYSVDRMLAKRRIDQMTPAAAPQQPE